MRVLVSDRVTAPCFLFRKQTGPQEMRACLLSRMRKTAYRVWATSLRYQVLNPRRNHLCRSFTKPHLLLKFGRRLSINAEMPS
jgi:hypothetical protein